MNPHYSAYIPPSCPEYYRDCIRDIAGFLSPGFNVMVHPEYLRSIRDKISNGNIIIQDGLYKFEDELIEHAFEYWFKGAVPDYNPKYMKGKNLKKYTSLLQVLMGKDLNSPSLFLLCFYRDTSPQYHEMFIEKVCRKNGIPILNLFQKHDPKAFVWGFLKKNFPRKMKELIQKKEGMKE